MTLAMAGHVGNDIIGNVQAEVTNPQLTMYSTCRDGFDAHTLYGALHCQF